MSVAKNRNRRLIKYARRVEPPKSRELCRVVPLTCPSEGGRYHVIASLARLGNDISMFGLFLYSILSEEMSRSAFLPTPRCDMSSFTKKNIGKRGFFFTPPDTSLSACDHDLLKFQRRPRRQLRLGMRKLLDGTLCLYNRGYAPFGLPASQFGASDNACTISRRRL